MKLTVTIDTGSHQPTPVQISDVLHRVCFRVRDLDQILDADGLAYEDGRGARATMRVVATPHRPMESTK